MACWPPSATNVPTSSAAAAKGWHRRAVGETVDLPRGGHCSARVSRPRRLPDRRSPAVSGYGDPRSAGWRGHETSPQHVVSRLARGKERRVAFLWGPDPRIPLVDNG